LFAQAAKEGCDPNAPTGSEMFCYGGKVLRPGDKVVTGA
jgi:hypothetical protein